ncbi:hypothetical protein PCCS19_16530 [Paenibacillus sp. CCS19]|uniref:type I polyketide synthase n=1 Tax=Paenibacillus sp. CCS19 TaxID=3158387 RepID=UPI002566E198|nr:SDR family NAD(P)-dependent oxidoreductase [Paenibacillus cellulosilyticus]GMK38599.1 hypothetical protein PCCS19_16530 [Paenibacillus cellulosilyticus]
MQLVKQYILENAASQQLSPQDAKAMLKEIAASNARRSHEDIAIIGISGKLPGAGNMDEYWDNLQQGKSCIGSFPESRAYEWIDALNNERVMEFMTGQSLPKGVRAEDVVGGVGGFLDEIDKFDAAFFKISAREAKYIDPAHRLFLETAWEAIEDAGYGGSKIYGTNTGVFVGKDHATLPMYRLMTEPDQMHLTGSWPGILSSRLSYLFNLRGPSIVFDTACSAGLVALHQACQALRNKECDMAVVGGVQVQYMAMKEESGPMDLGMVESDTSLVCTFDKDANGTVWGEGVVSFVLKPLAKAQADRDLIHAVIKGSAINNDGASNGITAPNAKAQEDVIMRAWEDADIHPDTIQYIEAHGTGTSLGDPIEISGLTNAFGKYTSRKQFCGIGSVKTSIGHTVAASGLAALAKVVLSLKNRKMPANLNFRQPNPYINFPDSPLYVNDVLADWPRGAAPRRAGVSSFGFSGTNAHVIVEEAPEQPASAAASANAAPAVQVLTISAKNEHVLRAYIDRYAEFLKRQPDARLEDVCFTANTGRGHYTHRVALLALTAGELRASLRQLQEGGLHTDAEAGIWYGQHFIVSENQKTAEAGAITAGALKKLSAEAAPLVGRLNDADLNNSRSAAAELCQHYVKGADIHWEEVYRNSHRSRVRIPVYPLERVRTWAETKVFTNGDGAQSAKTYVHPLVDRKLVDSIDQTIFESNLSVDTHWMLKEHRFMGSYIIPGVTYLEWGREVCASVMGTSSLELRDVYFMSPLVVAEGDARSVQAIVKKESDHLKFTIASRSDSDESQWIIHSEGKAYRLESSVQPKLDMAAIRSRTPISRPIGEFNPEAKSFYLGYHWDNLVAASADAEENEVLLQLRLRDEYVHEMEQFEYHPSILDNAVNPMIKFLDDVYLPFTFKKFQMFGRMPKTLYSYFRKKDGDQEKKATLAYNITLADAEGNVVAEIEDYSIKRMGAMEQMKFRMENNRGDHLNKLSWVSEPLAADTAAAEHNSIMVIKGAGDYSDAIADAYRSQGAEVIEVQFGDAFQAINSHRYIIAAEEADYRQLLNAVRSIPFTQIVHAAALAGGEAVASPTQLSERLDRGVYSLFRLTRALLAEKVGRPLDIVLLTEYMNEVDGSEQRIEPHNAALMGLGKVLKDEYGALAARCVDIDSVTSAGKVMEELKAQSTPYAVAYRNGERFVQEFGRVELKDYPIEPVELREEGCYIITGGTGGLGLEIAKYLARKKPIQLVLMNRTELPPREQWESIIAGSGSKKLQKKLEELIAIEQVGAKVQCLAVDVADLAAMSDVADRLRGQYGSINGIVHAAGVAGDGFIIKKDEKTFTEVLSPKIIGTWVLDLVTEADRPDFFISFSSIASMLGGPGQGDYTAANSYLDAYTPYRNRKGLRTVSINWPSWKETGMAVDYGMAHEDGLFLPIGTAQALEVMDSVLSYTVPSLLPGEVNFPLILKLGGELPMRVSKQILSQLDKHSRSFVNGGSAQGKKKVREQVLLKGKDAFSKTENKLGLIWAQVLDLDDINVFDHFNDLGGDSILSIQLFKEINGAYPGLMEISDIFTYSTVAEQANFIASKQQPSAELDEEQLKQMLDALADGTASVEEGLAIVTGEGSEAE